MYFPISGVTVEPWILVLIGFAVGVCGGFFGIGGAFLVTPALNILGFPMAYAIGTDMAHITGKSVVSSLRHRKLGNVDVKAGLLLVLGTVPGVEAGARAIMWLEGLGRTETVVRWVYMFLLLAIGTGMLRDYLRGESRSGRLAERLQAVRLRPLVSLPKSGIQSISLWLILGIGLATGFCAGFLGVGGGFIRVPALIYFAGMPTRIAVGTDLLEVLFSGAYGSFTYALKGRVDILAALIMLTGAAVGSQIGAVATDHVKGYRIRLYFALTVLTTALAVALKQFGLGTAAAVILLGAGSAMSLAIIISLAASLIAERKEYVREVEPTIR
jgi:uncharacterized membrane protein YfcA